MLHVVRLRCLLQEHGIQIPAAQSNTVIPVITNALPGAHIPVLKAEQRIALFRSLFHGRDDVYAALSYLMDLIDCGVSQSVPHCVS